MMIGGHAYCSIGLGNQDIIGHAKPLKKFPNHLYGQPVLTFAVPAVASVWMNINTVKLQYNKEFIMFVFYFKMV